MSDRGFERPGDLARPAPEHWPYHTPTPEEPTPNAAPNISVATQPPGPPTRRLRLLVAGAIGVLAGVALGGVWVSGIVREPAAPAPTPITVETFPRQLLGTPRNDITLRDAGFRPTIERLDSEFQEQLSAFRFAHGGDGATLGYGRLMTLTIVNGVLSPTLPREGSVGGDGRPPQSRRLVSLRTAETSCTFEPKTIVDGKTGLADLGGLNSDGRTDCVLVDSQRNLSLRIAHVEVARDVDALDSATSFRDELQTIHQQILG